MPEERQVFRIGRREGVAGDSPHWQLRVGGRVRQVDREELRVGLKAGKLTGIESVRKVDGDWGPLFGRPVYREVFRRRGLEPRDHAKARAAARIERLTRRSWIAVAVAVVAVGASVPLAGVWMQALLVVSAGGAITGGLLRLRAAMERVLLDGLEERLVPPVTPPPPVEDWAWEAAQDEVASYLSDDAEEGDQGSGSGSDGASTPDKTRDSVSDSGA